MSLTTFRPSRIQPMIPCELWQENGAHNGSFRTHEELPVIWMPTEPYGPAEIWKHSVRSGWAKVDHYGGVDICGPFDKTEVRGGPRCFDFVGQRGAVRVYVEVAQEPSEFSV